MVRLREDKINFAIINVTFVILILEHFVLSLELAKPLLMGWSVVTLIFNAVMVIRYGRYYKDSYFG